MREEFEYVLKQAKTGEKYTMLMKEVGSENNFVFSDITNLHAFLSMREDCKAKCEMQYKVNKDSNIMKELNQVWDMAMTFCGSYSDDYDIVNNRHSCSHQTTWTDKYTRNFSGKKYSDTHPMVPLGNTFALRNPYKAELQPFPIV